LTTGWLFAALLFPRCTLLWSNSHGLIPANDVPYWADVLCAICAPRFLIAYYAHFNQADLFWVILFFICGLAELGVISSSSRTK